MKYRNSHPEVFCKKGVLRNFSKFTGIARFLRTSFLVEHFRGRFWKYLTVLLFYKQFPYFTFQRMIFIFEQALIMNSVFYWKLSCFISILMQISMPCISGRTYQIFKVMKININFMHLHVM